MDSEDASIGKQKELLQAAMRVANAGNIAEGAALAALCCGRRASIGPCVEGYGRKNMTEQLPAECPCRAAASDVSARPLPRQ